MIQMILTGLLCGALLGFVMQRGRFCLTGGFRDMYIAKDNRMFYALLIAIAVQSIGVYTLIQMDVIQFSTGAFPWVAVIIGSFVFGIGIILAGGCATGTWYRAGEGLLGSWMALAGYMLMSTIMKSGPLTPVNESISSVVLPKNSIAGRSDGVLHAKAGERPGWIVHCILAYFVGRFLQKPRTVKSFMVNGAAVGTAKFVTIPKESQN